MTSVIFSNNTSQKFHITTEILREPGSFIEGRDFKMVKSVVAEPLYSNFNLFEFYPQKMKNKEFVYVHAQITKPDLPNRPIDLYFAFEKVLFSYKMSDIQIVLPSNELKSVEFNRFATFSLSDEWPDFLLHVSSYENMQTLQMWPHIVLAIDSSSSSIQNTFKNSSPKSFRMMSYNIQIFPFYADAQIIPNNKTERLQNIPKLIGNNFDYVVFNEVFDAELRTKLKNLMLSHYPYYATPSGVDSIKALSSGVMVFSRWPIVREEKYIYENCHGYECLAAKGITYTQIIKTVDNHSQNVHIFSTHLQAESRINGIEAFNRPRQKQLKELANFIQMQNIPASEPILIAGDMNVDAYENLIDRFDGETYQTEYEYMLSILNAADPVQKGLKYSADYLLNTMLALSSKSQSKIDYIFYSKSGLIPKMSMNAVITLRDTYNPKMYPIYDTSDHFPVVGEFLFD